MVRREGGWVWVWVAEAGGGQSQQSEQYRCDQLRRNELAFPEWYSACRLSRRQIRPRRNAAVSISSFHGCWISPWTTIAITRQKELEKAAYLLPKKTGNCMADQPFILYYIYMYIFTGFYSVWRTEIKCVELTLHCRDVTWKRPLKAQKIETVKPFYLLFGTGMWKDFHQNA